MEEKIEKRKRNRKIPLLVKNGKIKSKMKRRLGLDWVAGQHTLRSTEYNYIGGWTLQNMEYGVIKILTFSFLLL